MNAPVGEEETIDVRLATEPDALMLARLRYDFRNEFHELTEHDEAFVERCRVWMQDRLRTGSHWKCWIAERGQAVVGNVWAQFVEKIPNPLAEPEQYVYVTNFYVRAEHRGTGVGAKLMAAVLAWTRSESVHTIILWPSKRSRDFYSRHGFAITDDIMQLEIGAKRS